MRAWPEYGTQRECIGIKVSLIEPVTRYTCPGKYSRSLSVLAGSNDKLGAFVNVTSDQLIVKHWADY